MSSLANIRNLEMFVGDFDVGYHGASCHGLAWSCTRKIGKAEALVVVLHQDTQGQSDASPTCPHSSMSSYLPATRENSKFQGFQGFLGFQGFTDSKIKIMTGLERCLPHMSLFAKTHILKDFSDLLDFCDFLDF